MARVGGRRTEGQTEGEPVEEELPTQRRHSLDLSASWSKSSASNSSPIRSRGSPPVAAILRNCCARSRSCLADRFGMANRYLERNPIRLGTLSCGRVTTLLLGELIEQDAD